MISSIPRRRQLARWQRSLAPSLGCCSCSWRASVTSACSSGHTSTPALCTADGRKLSRSTSYVVPGPGGGAGELTVSIADASANENDGMIRFTATLARTHRQGEAGLEQGGVDMLAESGPLAGGEGGEDADGAVEPGPEVGDRNRDTERWSLGRPVDAHPPGHARSDEVEAAARSIRAGLAKPRDRAVLSQSRFRTPIP